MKEHKNDYALFHARITYVQSIEQLVWSVGDRRLLRNNVYVKLEWNNIESEIAGTPLCRLCTYLGM